jgi:hypothetical protein
MENKEKKAREDAAKEDGTEGGNNQTKAAVERPAD